ncbi:MAG: DUF1552 domain-containing protein [Deltaproteobacteria bacterium]|nr:DUF1552 domain-containing protein [Nannocystaceae bacterium]
MRNRFPTSSTRRGVLKGLGSGLVAAPWLPVLGARAGTPSVRRPQNLLLVYHPNGLEEGWQPQGAAGEFELGAVLAALADRRDDLMIASGFQGGISNEVFGHNEGMVSMWTGKRISGSEGYSEYPSIDQLAADRMGSLAPFRSLEFGVQTVAGTSLGNTSAMCYRDGSPIQAEDNPATMFDRMFATSGENPEQLRAERKSIFDATHASLTDIRVAYGAEDRDRIDRHMQFLRETELRLEGLAELSCAAEPSRVDNGADLAIQGLLFESAADIQMDLLTAGLSCGLTRVASLQYAHSTTSAPIAGYPMHGTMHAGTREQKVAMNEWFVAQFAGLLDRLAAVSFADGTTLLDDTLVVWGTEMAVGNHLNFPIPYIIAGGGADGYFKLGQWIDLSEQRPRHTRLLISVLHAMGIEDVESLGDFTEDGDRGPLDELRRST